MTEFKILENLIFSQSKIDKENMIIKNVAVLGSISKNNRKYTKQALEDAVRVFENTKAFLSHSSRQRSLNELIGFFKNLHISESDNKVKGDFYLLDESEIGKKILKIAETNPGLAGFSIDAVGKLRQENGETIVESIEKGNSIDLVLNPATVNGIFESLFQEQESEDNMPYPNEHACRMLEPSEFEKDTFRRVTREHNGKKYDIIMGKLKGKDTFTEQTYRYPKNTWTVTEAKKHCQEHKGKKFEPAKGVSESIESLSNEGEKMTEKKDVSLIEQDLQNLKEENSKLIQEIQELKEKLEKNELILFVEKELKTIPEIVRTEKLKESLLNIGHKEVISSIVDEIKEIVKRQKKSLSFVGIEDNDKPLTEKEIKEVLKL